MYPIILHSKAIQIASTGQIEESTDELAKFKANLSNYDMIQILHIWYISELAKLKANISNDDTVPEIYQIWYSKYES